jgi:hypothetical protein
MQSPSPAAALRRRARAKAPRGALAADGTALAVLPGTAPFRRGQIRSNTMSTLKDQPDSNDMNRDPLTGTPGAHPVGTGVGAAAGGAAGAAIGMVAGPVGALAGAVVGAVVGGLAGKGVAEGVNPTAEDAYWRDNFVREPYYAMGRSYEDYSPAYRVGYEGRGLYAGSFDDAEPELRRSYETDRGTSRLEWEEARIASRAAWHRVERAMPGDADGDGR